MNDQDENPYAPPQSASRETRSLALSDVVTLLLRAVASLLLLSPLAIAVDAAWNIFAPTAFGGAPIRDELPARSICVLYVLAILWALLYTAYRSRQEYN